MLIAKWRKLTTTVLGEASGNTDKMRGEAKLIYAKATSSDTRFDFKMLDKDGDEILLEEGNVGALRLRDPLYLEGIYTWSIENASADEIFTIAIQLRETVT